MLAFVPQWEAEWVRYGSLCDAQSSSWTDVAVDVPKAIGMVEQLRLAFAGDRQVGCRVLEFLLSEGHVPSALLLPTESRASHDAELIEQFAGHAEPEIFRGAEFRAPMGVARLSRLRLDYLVSVHFPYMIPQEVLDIPEKGCINLHPALLPYNRGWHTPTWSILEGTPAGATLHFMDKGLDTGDIISQKAVSVLPDDTATKLYERILEVEVELFRDTWPSVVAGRIHRVPQEPSCGTAHRREDLLNSGVQVLNLDDLQRIGDVIDRLRGLTTNRTDEACYFDRDGIRYRIRVDIVPDGSSQ